MQYRRAVCDIFIFLVYLGNLVTISCFHTFFNVQSNLHFKFLQIQTIYLAVCNKKMFAEMIILFAMDSKKLFDKTRIC